MISQTAYIIQLERLLCECRVVLAAATDHGSKWPKLSLGLALDKIDRLDINHEVSPDRCTMTEDMIEDMSG